MINTAKFFLAALLMANAAMAQGMNDWAQGPQTPHVFSMSCKVTAVNGDLATPEGRAKAVEWWKRNGFTKLWLETYRHGEYRRTLLYEVCERDILAPAKSANPNVHFIIKYPCWYRGYAERGYDPARQADLFGECWIGTETRDANPSLLQACWIMAWMDGLTGGKCGGGWYDALDCTPEKFIEQAYYTILGGARESFVHCCDYLLSDDPGRTPFGEKARSPRVCAEMFEREAANLRKLADFVQGAERGPFSMGENGVSTHEFRKDGKHYIVRVNTKSVPVDGLPPHGVELKEK